MKMSVEVNVSTAKMTAIASVPCIPTAEYMTSKTKRPKLLVETASGLTVQNENVMATIIPMSPLQKYDQNMERGTTMAAFFVSSANRSVESTITQEYSPKCVGTSTPIKATLELLRPIIKAMPLLFQPEVIE